MAVNIVLTFLKLDEILTSHLKVEVVPNHLNPGKNRINNPDLMTMMQRTSGLEH
jgi:hypothetical protein